MAYKSRKPWLFPIVVAAAVTAFDAFPIIDVHDHPSVSLLASDLLGGGATLAARAGLNAGTIPVCFAGEVAFALSLFVLGGPPIGLPRDGELVNDPVVGGGLPWLGIAVTDGSGTLGVG